MAGPRTCPLTYSRSPPLASPISYLLPPLLRPPRLDGVVTDKPDEDSAPHSPYPFTLASLLGVSEHVVVHAVGVVCGLCLGEGGSEGVGCRLLTHGTGPRCLHFECRGDGVWRRLPYLTLHWK